MSTENESKISTDFTEAGKEKAQELIESKIPTDFTETARKKVEQLIKSKTNPHRMYKALQGEKLCGLSTPALQNRIRKELCKEWINPAYGWIDTNDAKAFYDYITAKSDKTKTQSPVEFPTFHPTYFEGQKITGDDDKKAILKVNTIDNEDDTEDNEPTSQEDDINTPLVEEIIPVKPIEPEIKEYFLSLQKLIEQVHHDIEALKGAIIDAHANHKETPTTDQVSISQSKDIPPGNSSSVSINIEVKK